MLRRYYFNVRWRDHEDHDVEGILCADDAAAIAYAYRIIRELKEAGDYSDRALIMIVENEAREPLFSLPFQTMH